MTSPTALPLLYSFRRCPYAMRARLALLASATLCEIREVVLSRKPSALLQLSPKGTVPVLVLPDGTVLDQSLDIMLWALQRNDPGHWLPTSPAQLADALLLIARSDTEFKFHLDRYKYPNRYDLPDGLEHRALGSIFLHDLEVRLTDTGHIQGDHFGFLDAALAPFVRQFAHTDPEWFAQQPWQALQTWLKLFEASPDFAAVMEKWRPWEDGHTPGFFPDPRMLLKQ